VNPGFLCANFMPMVPQPVRAGRFLNLPDTPSAFYLDILDATTTSRTFEGGELNGRGI
jgi:hypothetical protein